MIDEFPGSSDLWVADSDCIVGCKGVPTFTSSASTSFRNLSQSFSITYGSGMARGVLGQDTVTMAGFSVAQQTFAICDTVSSGLLTNPVSGLLGLAWQTIASSGATPFWQTLAESGAWTEPLMAFQLTRFVNVSSSSELNPGGQFNMGFLNKSIYTGSVEYTNIPNGVGSYWIAPLTKLTVGGSGIALPGGSASYAAIDTGTTLVGGPPAQIAALYAQIPGAAQGTGDLEGYWTYPCATSVTVGMAFGGATTWQISPADFALAAVDRRGETCLGAFFELETGGNAPAWIVGDTFLKNVYSVYRFNPPSIGFAALNNGAVQALADGPVPTPTIGAIVAEVSAGRNGALSSVRSLSSSHMVALTGFVAAVAWMM
jgi:cathepsin D